MALPRLLGQTVLDVVSVLVVAAPLFLLENFARPYHRGFFCNDNSIALPYHNDSVPSYVLLTVVFVVPFILIVTVEALHYIAGKLLDRSSDQWTARNYFTLLYKIYGIYIFGLVITMTITELGKFTIGRLRPHFLSVCQPNRTTLNCTDNTAGGMYYRYVTEDVCTTDNTVMLTEARKSFPSGHSSMSFFFAVFSVFYLQSRMTYSFSRLLKPCLQTLLVSSAVYISLSRISDYMHHWSDVFVGALVGTIAAILVGVYVSSQISGWKLEPLQTNYQQLEDGDRTMSIAETRDNP